MIIDKEKSFGYEKSPFFVRLDANNYFRMKKFFEEKDMCYLINEFVDNALTDFFCMASHVSEACVDDLVKEVDENGFIEC